MEFLESLFLDDFSGDNLLGDELEMDDIPSPDVLSIGVTDDFSSAPDQTNDLGTLDSGKDNLVQDFDEWFQDTHGTPIEDSLAWHPQTTDYTCGIVSSEMVMKTFGLDISESQLVYEATSEGLLSSDDGMSMEGIQTILGNHGIETSLQSGSATDLASHLDQGDKIIVALDSGELWGVDSPFEDFVGEESDHAVMVTGIDLTGTEQSVTLNDPGHPDGQGMIVPLDDFLDAWKDSNNEFIYAKQPGIA
jgi:hypothetical protein